MQVPVCPNVLSAAYLAEVAAGENVTVCSEQQINLNGSAIALYNDTSYYDDLTFAATWLYRATGDTDYLSQAESWYVAHLYGTTSTSSVRTLQAPPPLHPPPPLPYSCPLSSLSQICCQFSGYKCNAVWQCNLCSCCGRHTDVVLVASMPVSVMLLWCCTRVSHVHIG